MPLTFDLPIEQLITYRGKNPCPYDFDSFWDKSLAEMRSLDSQIELTPAEFQAPNVECFHLFFTGIGGARIHAKLLRPVKAPSPTLPYCCSTGTPVILGIGSISLAMLRQVSPWQHWIVAARQDYLKMQAGSPATHSTDILFVDLMTRYGMHPKRCFSGRYFSIQPNLPGLLWKCPMWMRIGLVRWALARVAP